MVRIILSILLCFSFPVFIFGQIKCGMLLYPQGSHTEDTAGAIRIKKIEYRGIHNYVTVTLEDDTKVKFLKKEIWGYKSADCKIYRYGSKRDVFYRVMQRKDIIIYSFERTAHYYRSTGKIRDYAFGKTLSGAIYYLNEKNIREQYGNNECIIKLLDELKWYQHPSNYNKKTRKFKIEEFIEKCNS